MYMYILTWYIFWASRNGKDNIIYTGTRTILAGTQYLEGGGAQSWLRGEFPLPRISEEYIKIVLKYWDMSDFPLHMYRTYW